MKTNDATRATAEGLPTLTRRLFLRNTAVAGAIAATAVPAVAEPSILTPRERLDAAIEELKAASEAIWPDVNDWTVNIGLTDRVPVLVAAYTPLGREMAEPFRKPNPEAVI